MRLSQNCRKFPMRQYITLDTHLGSCSDWSKISKCDSVTLKKWFLEESQQFLGRSNNSNFCERLSMSMPISWQCYQSLKYTVKTWTKAGLPVSASLYFFFVKAQSLKGQYKRICTEVLTQHQLFYIKYVNLIFFSFPLVRIGLGSWNNHQGIASLIWACGGGVNAKVPNCVTECFTNASQYETSKLNGMKTLENIKDHSIMYACRAIFVCMLISV